MAGDRRALLRRALLKEQLNNEAQQPQSNDNFIIPPPRENLPDIGDVSNLTPEQIAAQDEKIRGEVNLKELQPVIAGAAQGSTFGFSDELGAAKDVAGDVLSGKGTDDLASKWRAYQQSREQANKQLKEESPGKYAVGELGGGLVSAALMPSVGAEQMAARMSPRLAAFLAGRAPAAAMTKLAGKATSGLIEGAPIGALYGAGTSESNISNPEELGKDIISGAKMGSLTGAALTGASKVGGMAVDKVSSLAKDSKFMQQLKQAYKYGKEGTNLGSGAVQENLSTLPIDHAKELTSRMTLVDQELGQKVGNAINNAQKEGIKINIDDSLQEASQKMFNTLFVENPTLGQTLDPKTAKLLKVIANREQGDLSPIEAKALRDQLYELNDSLSGYNSDAASFAKRLGRQLSTSLDSNLKNQIPEYKQAASQFETFRRLVPETIISKGTPSEYGKAYMGDMSNPELKLFESNKDMLQHSQLPGSGVERQRATLQQLYKNLKDLEKQNPEAVKGLGGSAEDVINNIKDKSSELGMLRQAMGHEPHVGGERYATGQLFGFATSGAGQGMSVANKLGLVSRGVKQSTPVQTANKVFSLADDSLRGLVEKLKSSSSASGMGEALENALNNKNEVAKNAVLFKLMQNPDYRNMLKDQGGTE